MMGWSVDLQINCIEMFIWGDISLNTNILGRYTIEYMVKHFVQFPTVYKMI